MLLALAAARPAAAEVYHLDGGVVRVRYGSGSGTSTTVRRTAPVANRVPLAESRAQPVVESVQPEPVQTVIVPAQWDKAAALATLDEAAAQARLPSALLEALVWQESRWRPYAVSPKGAVGLTQLMPVTARELGVDPHDPTANLFGGARHLRGLIDHFDGDLVKALAAYNAGVRRVEQAGGIPQIAETQNYVVAILTRASARLGMR